MIRLHVLAAVVVLGGSAVHAQCGNGGAGTLTQSVLAVGATATTTVGGGPGQLFGIYLSDGFAPVAVPGLGTVCLDVGSPGFALYVGGTLPATGQASYSAVVPNNPLWLSIVFFMQAAVTDPAAPSGIALTRTLRKDYELPDSMVSTQPMTMAVARPAMATVAGRGWVLASGGRFSSSFPPAPVAQTSIYFPVLRSFAPGPSMAVPRYGHSATALPDGRLLICGGASSLGGAVLSSCEIFDPTTFSIVATAPMNVPRTRHEALLLADGRMLVTGGSPVDGYTITGSAISAAHYNSAHLSAELYDPATGTWAPAGNAMSVRRIDHGTAQLGTGSVIVAGGFDTAIPNVFGFVTLLPTASVDIFDPGTGLFTAGPPLPFALAEHGMANITPNQILVCGGTGTPISPNPGAATPTATSWIFLGSTWQPGPTLPNAMSGVTALPLPGGSAWVGSFLIDAAANRPARLDVATGTFVPAAAPLSPRYWFSAAALEDGALLICGGGGYLADPTLATTELYTP